MRLFVAMDISDETRAEVRGVRAALERRIAESRHPPRVTWVADDNAHVTLRFIGEVPDPVGRAVRQTLDAPFVLRPFELVWTAVGTFPGGNRPHVVWIGCDAAARASALAEAVNARLESVIGPGEGTPFRPHVTVGRVKDPGRNFDWANALSDVKIARTISVVDHVTLYQSRTSPKGPTYTPLAKTLLVSG